MLYFLWFIMGGIIAASFVFSVKSKFCHRRRTVIIAVIDAVLIILLAQFTQYKAGKLHYLEKQLDLITDKGITQFEKNGSNAQAIRIILEIDETKDSNLSNEKMEKKISELESKISDIENIQNVENNIHEWVSNYKAESKKDVWLGAMLSVLTGCIVPTLVGFKDEIKDAVKNRKKKKRRNTKRK